MVSIERKLTIPYSLGSRILYNFNSEINRKIKSSVYFSKGENDRIVNAKSLLGLLSAQFNYGDEIIVHIIGNDNESCLSDFEELNRIIKTIGGK